MTDSGVWSGLLWDRCVCLRMVWYGCARLLLVVACGHVWLCAFIGALVVVSEAVNVIILVVVVVLASTWWAWSRRMVQQIVGMFGVITIFFRNGLFFLLSLTPVMQ